MPACTPAGFCRWPLPLKLQRLTPNLFPLMNRTRSSSRTVMQRTMASKRKESGVRNSRGAMTRVACNKCRVKKHACDGARPVCGRCQVTKDVCVFDTEAGESRTSAVRRERDALRRENETLQRRNSALKQALSGVELASMDIDSGDLETGEPDVLTSRRTARSEPPVTAACGSDSLHRLLRQSANGSTPTSQSALELELMIRHPVVYPQYESAEIDALTSLHFQETRSLFGNIKFGSREASLHDYTRDTVYQSSISTKMNHPASIFGRDYCDVRLEHLEIGFWSHVGISNSLAASLISLYLETDHPILGFFDAELFLDDLVNQRTRFCSSLLVNAVLLWSCHSYAAFDQNAILLKQRYLSETLRLWHAQENSTSICALASALFLNLSYVCCGDDRLAADFIREAQRIGEDLALFGPPEEVVGLGGPEILQLKARSHTAWGAFNYITLRAMSYRDLFMMRTPKYAIPGDSAVLSCTLGCESPVFHLLPDFMGTTFPKLCKLWLIVNEIVLASFAYSQAAFNENVTVEFAEITLQKLLHWADTLDDDPGTTHQRMHHEEIFHVFFHAAILDLFRPFTTSNLPLRTFSSQHKTSRDVFLASVNQLKRHVLTHLSRYASAAYSVLWHFALLQVANATLTDLDDPKSQLFFLLCLRRYHDLSQSFPIMSSIVRGLLGIAVRAGSLPPHQARLILVGLEGTNGSTANLKHPAGTFAIDLNLALIDFPSAQAQSLFEAF